MDVPRPRSRALRLATIAIVALALAGAKVSGAFAALLPAGDGVRTVVLCTGTGLVRVALDARGAVVDGDADDGAPGDGAAPLAQASHCDLVASPRADAERRWATIGRASTGASSRVPRTRAAPVRAARAPRDPPPRGPPVRV